MPGPRTTTLQLLLLLGLAAPLVGLSPDCHNAGCLGDLTCEPPITYITPNATLDKCCPACVPYLDLNSSCPISTVQCLPGLECSLGICTPTNANSRKCQSYPFRSLLWSPKCEADGTFAAVQCKGEPLTGRCFCYSEIGKRIFGQQWTSRAENMTCECSRRSEALKATGRNDVTLHCSEDGNFEALQCDDGVCWCAEEKHGDALSEVVPAAMMELLPCYNKTIVGDTYLRRCDSASSALSKIRDEMTQHGTLFDAFVDKKCGLDGSYGEFLFENGINFCTWRDSGKIGSYMTSETPRDELNCNCARDTKYFAQEGFGFTMACAGNGNYIRLQVLNDDPMCVDSDGFSYKKPTIDNGISICENLP